MKVIVSDIDWDLDEEDGDADLPEEVEVSVPASIANNEDAVNDCITEWLSSEYGYLVNGFSVSKEEQTDESLCV